MARCYPQDPHFTDKGGAEKAVFEALRDALPEDALLFHSVQLRDGSAEHEIDLLVLWPEVGIAAIEVKAERGRVTPEQQRFIDVVREAGGVAGVARSVDDARAILSDER